MLPFPIIMNANDIADSLAQCMRRICGTGPAVIKVKYCNRQLVGGRVRFD